jgi:hypothetical protein
MTTETLTDPSLVRASVPRRASRQLGVQLAGIDVDLAVATRLVRTQQLRRPAARLESVARPPRPAPIS